MAAVRPLAHPDLRDPTLLSLIGARLRQALGAQRVLVYGSVARGEATIHSDVDLLVIAPSTEPKGHLRMAAARAAIRDLSVGLPISPLVVTPDELSSRLRSGDPFLREALATGVDV